MIEKRLEPGFPLGEDELIEVSPRISGRFGGLNIDQGISEDFQTRLAQATEADFTEELPQSASRQEGFPAATNLKGRHMGRTRGMMERFMRWADPLNHPVEPESPEDPANWPKKLHMGFMSEVKRKDLLRYIGEWVIDNAESKTACFYQIVPWSGGFAYEVQEGGAGFGVLRSALEALDTQGEVTLPANDRNVQLVRKAVGFATYMPNELEEQVISPNLFFTDPLKPVYSRHHGLMVSGVLASLFGVVAFLSAWFVVYQIYGKDKVPVYSQSSHELPWQQLGKVESVLQKPEAYLHKLTYQNGAWRVEEKKVVQEQPTAAPAPPINQPATSVDAASQRIERANILNELEKTISESK